MYEKFDPFSAKLDGLTDQEIEARIAAAIWVDDKQAFVLRYLEDKKLERRKAAKAEELEAARSARTLAKAALDLAKDAQAKAKLAFTIAGVATAAAIALAAVATAVTVLKP